ncbi:MULTISPECIES: glycosyltransferase family 4 protein [Shewanella]|uniref:glycosyltransferase family 4 protein n=1 Tax=Shewanella TaxID=22 RepID=UPI000C325507|nr:glycosyltransferase family 4 protein [Shewanella algae]MBO2640746.1 glycosyltransferase family 4 protein [Shewanella algae]
MPKIISVATRVGVGKGGISTALIGYSNSSAMKSVPLVLVASHEEGKLIKSFFSSFFFILRSCEKNDAVWFHCGPWFSMLRKFILSVVVRFKRGRVFYHIHSPKMADYILNGKYNWLLNIFFKSSDGIMVLTPWWKDLLLNKYPYLSGKIEIAPNPLDHNFMAIAHERTNNSERKNIKILSMARLVEGKGFSSVIDAMTIMPDNFSLTIAGDGPLMSSLKNKVYKLGLDDRVSFTGWINYEKKSELYLNHDLFCLTSKYDSFGMGYLEAMACGLPVVALAYQAIPDVVPDSLAGVLINDDDIYSIKKAIEICVKNRARMSLFAKKHVVESFDAEVISSRVISFMGCNNE